MARTWKTLSCRVDEDTFERYSAQCSESGFSNAGMLRHFVEEVAAGNVSLKVAKPEVTITKKSEE